MLCARLRWRIACTSSEASIGSEGEAGDMRHRRGKRAARCGARNSQVEGSRIDDPLKVGFHFERPARSVAHAPISQGPTIASAARNRVSGRVEGVVRWYQEVG
jgi:hypothetical protein